MSYRISLTPQAESDLDTILDYIQQRSAQGVQAWFSSWLQVCDLLSQSPERQTLAPENPDHEEAIRNVIFKTRYGNPCRCIFLIRDDTVHVLHIRGYGQEILGPDELRLPDG